MPANQGIWSPGDSETFAPPTQGFAAWLARMRDSILTPETPAQTWTPAYLDLTPGNGVLARNHFRRIGGIIHWEYRLVFGTTTAVSGTLRISLPATAADGNNGTVGGGYLRDLSVPTTYMANARLVNSTEMNIFVDGSSGFVGSAFPFTWAVNDIIALSGSYIAA